ncbi:unnamed protein product [Owenia fusiformis]|uniref:Uncharacterized protein n=1 Tax=Owenia fusiformis TaxID=6347 RepID=A0A8J1U241_OWEFU|nr:unnamed protein product [Owenia fusiformis]
MTSDTKHRTFRDDITLVTMYLNLGCFQKGKEKGKYVPKLSKKLYDSWMPVFGKIANPTVMYCETDELEHEFKDYRKSMLSTATKVIQSDRSKLWSFTKQPAVEKIYGNPDYPHFHPNTIAEYTCCMHAKYDVLEDAIENNFFNTKYYAWLDVGYFRDLATNPEKLAKRKNFKLMVPADFDPTKVAYCVVWPEEAKSPFITTEKVFKENRTWIGGGYFLATGPVMLEWIKEYRRYVQKFLEMGLSNSDQQILFAMLHTEDEKPKVPVQLYTLENPGKETDKGGTTRGRSNPWFYLGYLCKATWEKKMGIETPKEEACNVM